MAIKGKIFGALLGFMLGRVVGAFIGAFLGHLLIDQRRRGYNPFFHTTFAVMGHIGKSGGRITEADIALASALMDRWGLTGKAREAAQAAYREGKSADFPLAERLRILKAGLAWRKDLARVFIEIQVQAALSDGKVDEAERKILLQVAAALGFSNADLDALIAMRQGERHGHQAGMSDDDARKILGVLAGDDLKVIKKAYRKLMAQHHPDKLASQGLPPEMAEVARQKSQDIQAAWEHLRSRVA